ncbi:MAG: hypothetical protein HOV82_16870 [Streptomyces sp.]|nr:hypothetical protein [Streptomyces sp.]NUP36152.1 hypothetical protein [Streptomyces sp.]NUS75499.1 hypothetical protein [Streptomyces sp.]
MFGITTTRRTNAEAIALKAEANRQRERAEKAEKAQATAEFNREQVLRQNADLEARLNRALTDLAAEKQRADQLETSTSADNLKAITEWEQRIKAHDAWRGPHDLEARPVDGASARPLHPAIELRRTRDRCRDLEARLSDAEGRKRGVTL